MRSPCRRVWVEGLRMFSVFTIASALSATLVSAVRELGGPVIVSTLDETLGWVTVGCWVVALVLLLRGVTSISLAVSVTAVALELIHVQARHHLLLVIPVVSLVHLLEPVGAIAVLVALDGRRAISRSYWWTAVVALPLVPAAMQQWAGERPLGALLFFLVFSVFLPLLLVAAVRDVDPRAVAATAMYLAITGVLGALSAAETTWRLHANVLYLWPTMAAWALQIVTALVAVGLAVRATRSLGLTI